MSMHVHFVFVKYCTSKIRLYQPHKMYKTLESLIKANHVSTAGVVVSCKIPILAIRVRFPGSAQFCFHKVWHLSRPCTYLRNYVCTLAWMGAYVYACMCACVCKCGGPPKLLSQVNKCSKSENKITSISVNVGPYSVWACVPCPFW